MPFVSGATNSDTKVVSLVFDNSKFEANAKTSISTLESLKEALDISSNSKVFQELSNGIRSISIAPLSDSIDVVMAKMSSFDVFTKSIFENITSDIYNTTKRFIESVTIAPIADGWSKYADKTAAVQTIMSATAKEWDDQGKQMEFVNSQLDLLNWFTDETSYNFLDMVNNIGKFTNNSIPLEEATTDMMGIATWAAKSGAGIQGASRAMYNLSQAIGMGSVRLSDWMSIELANMATTEFKNAVLETAEAMGTLTKVSDDTWQTIGDAPKEVTSASFREYLSEGWFTSDVLSNVLQQYGSFSNKLSLALENLDNSVTATRLLLWVDQFMDGSIDMERAADKAGTSVEELTEILTRLSDKNDELGRTGLEAAQEAKTFGEAVDSIKDATSSGWLNTFQILFGDYLDAKKIWTELSVDLYDAFAAGAEVRNDFIQKVFEQTATVNTREWGILEQSQGQATDAFKNRLIELGREYGTITDGMIVDTDNFVESLDQGWLTLDMLRQVNARIKATDFGESIFNFDSETGEGSWSAADMETRAIWMDTLTSSMKALAEVMTLFREIAVETFDINTDSVRTFILNVHNGVNLFRNFIANNDDLHDAIGGVVSVVNILADVMTFKFRVAYATVNAVLNAFGTDIIGVLGYLGRFATGIRDWLNDSGLIQRALTYMSNRAERYAGAVRRLLDAFLDFPGVASTFKLLEQGVISIGKNTGPFLDGLSEQFGELKARISTLDGLSFKNVGAAFTAFKETVIDYIVNFPGFSTMKEAFESLKTTILNAFDAIGIKSEFVTGIFSNVVGAGRFVYSTFKTVGVAIYDFISAIARSKTVQSIFAAVTSSVSTFAAGTVDFFGGLFNSIGEFTARVGELDGISFDNISAAFKIFGDTVLSYITGWHGFDSIKAGFKAIKQEFDELVENIDTLTFDDIIAAFDKVKTSVFEYLKNTKWYPIVSGAFSALGKKIKSFFTSIGIDVETIENIFIGLGNLGSGALYIIGDAALSVIQWFGQLISTVTNGASITDILGGFKQGFKDFADNSSAFVEGLKDKIAEFKAKVEELGGVRLDKLGEIFAAFRDTVIDYVANFDGFASLGEAFNKVKDIILAALEVVVNTFSSVKDRIFQLIELIASKLAGFILPKSIKEVLGFVKPPNAGALEEAVDSVGTAIKDFSERAKKASEDTTPLVTILKHLWDTATGLLAVYTLLRAMDLAKTISTVVQAVKAPETLKPKSGNGGDNFLKMAVSIGILTGAFYVLATKVPPKKILPTIGALSALTGILVGFTAAASAVTRHVDGSKVNAVGTAVLKLSLSMLAISGAFLLLQQIEPEKAGTIAGATIAVVALMAGAMFGLTKMGSAADKAGNGILKVIAALGLLALIFKFTQDLFKDNADSEDDSFKNTCIFLGVSIAALLGVVAVLSLIGKKLGTAVGSAASILAVAGSLLLVGLAFKLLSTFDWNAIGRVAVLAGVALGYMAALMAIATALGYNISAAGTILAIAGAITIMSVAFIALSFVPDLGKSIGALGYVTTMLMALMAVAAVVGNFMSASGFAALIVLGVIIAELGVIFMLMGILPVDKINAIAHGLAEALLAIGGFMLVATLVGSLIVPALIGIAAISAVIAAILLVVHFFGDAIAGDVEQMLSHLPKIANYVKDFATALDGVSWDTIILAVDKVNAVSGMLARAGLSNSVVTLSEVLNSIFGSKSKNVKGKDTFTLFKERSIKLAGALTEFEAAAKLFKEIDIPEDDINALTRSINAIPKGGWFDKLPDAATMDSYKENVKALGETLEAFDIALGSEFDGDRVEKAANATSQLAEAGNLLNTIDFGSGWGETKGESDYDRLSNEMGAVGVCLSKLSSYNYDADKVELVTECLSTLITASTDLNGFTVSDSDIFNVELIDELGTNISNIVDYLNKLGDIDLSNIDILKQAMDDISDILSKTPDEDTIDDLKLALKELNGITSYAGYGSVFGYGDVSESIDGTTESLDALTTATNASSSAIGDCQAQMQELTNKYSSGGFDFDPSTMFGSLTNYDASNIEAMGQDIQNAVNSATESIEAPEVDIPLGVDDSSVMEYIDGIGLGGSPLGAIGKLAGKGISGALGMGDISSITNLPSSFGAGDDSVVQAIVNFQTTNATNLHNVVAKLTDLEADIDNLRSAVASMKLVLDTGALVGEIAGDIDRELGNIYATGTGS